MLTGNTIFYTLGIFTNVIRSTRKQYRYAWDWTDTHVDDLWKTFLWFYSFIKGIRKRTQKNKLLNKS